MSIENHSGKKYDNAKLKLIAGDVNTVNNATPQPFAPMAMNLAGGSAPSFS